MAGYKTISILSLIVVVALAGVSPVFAQESYIRFDPAAACPGDGVVVYLGGAIDGDGLGTAVSTNLNGEIDLVLLSDPDGLMEDYGCELPATINSNNLEIAFCKVLISESARCGHYTVTADIMENGRVLLTLGSAPFDVAGSCCPAVGGCVQPVNTFALLSPWVAVIGLVGFVGAVVVVTKRKT